MIHDIILLLLGIAGITLGAESLVRGSASLAIRFGITPLVVGLTIVAFGTSSPELVVGFRSSLHNQGDIVIGTVVGSNIFNIGFILGLVSMIYPINVSLPVIRLDAPIMIFVSLLSLSLFAMGTISRAAGIFLFSGLIAYTIFTVLMAKQQTSAEIDRQFEAGVSSVSKSIYLDLVFITGGLALLSLGSRLLVGSAADIARLFGISEAFIGLTVIAAGTSLPELATSVAAAIRRQPDIALGNVVGSNIFNILGVLGVAAITRPLSAHGIKPFDYWVMVAFSILLLPLLWSRRKIQRWEGVLLLCGYGGYFYKLWSSL